MANCDIDIYLANIASVAPVCTLGLSVFHKIHSIQQDVLQMASVLSFNAVGSCMPSTCSTESEAPAPMPWPTCWSSPSITPVMPQEQ